MNRPLSLAGPMALALFASMGLAPEARAQIPQTGVYIGAPYPAPANNVAYGNWINRPETWAIDNLAAENWEDIENDLDDWATEPWGQWTAARSGRRLMLAVPMFPDGTTNGLANGAAGLYDAHFTTLAENLVVAGLGNAVIRIGWEFNGNWMPWRADVSPANFKTFWRRIVKAMRAVPGTEKMKFCWCPAIGTKSVAPDLCWPGGDYVDYIGADVYDDGWPYIQNSTPTATQRQQSWDNMVWMNHGLNWLRDFSQQEGRPICFPEWGLWDNHTRNGGGDNPGFIQNMYDWMRNPAHNVAMHAYFDFTPNASTVADHRLWPGADGTFVTQFPNAKAKFLQLFTGPTNGAHLWGSTSNARTGNTADSPVYAVDKIGPKDWTHWSAGGFVRKSGASLISNVTQIGGTMGTHSLATRHVSWAGGSPTASATDNQGYYFNNGVAGQGWSFTVPASPTPRTLHVFWGGAPYAGTKVKLVANFNDNSAPPFAVNRTTTATVNGYVTELTYASATNTTMNVVLTKDDNNSAVSVDIKSAWLQDGETNAANAHSGVYGARAAVTATPSYSNLFQIRPCTPSTNYVARVWVKGTGRISLRVAAGSFGTQLANATSVASGGWTLLTTPAFNTGTNSNLTYWITDSVGTPGTVYVDDAFLGVSGGTNLLLNPGFEAIAHGWSTGAPFTILKNP